ncbi:hypothetical protein M0R19_01745 [Candidatus Pacearchaeota archaeon]|jgi:hypothetical protein|nr:hypothetical protein [Candidatus Pacearchaeota archaeon]
MKYLFSKLFLFLGTMCMTGCFTTGKITEKNYGKFGFNDNASYFLRIRVQPTGNKEIPYWGIAMYDLNKNGKQDASAEYFFRGSLTEKFEMDEYAFRVLIDTDEDGTPDHGFTDKNFDGILDTKLTKKDIEKIFIK